MLPRSTRPIRLVTATVAALATCAALAGTATAAEFPTGLCGNKLCLDWTRAPDPALNLAHVTTGGIVTYHVTISRNATSTATKVVLRLNVPKDAELLEPKDARCSGPAADVITCSLGSLKPTDLPLEFTFNLKMGAADEQGTVVTLSSDARNSDTGTSGGDPTLETLTLADPLPVKEIDGEAVSAVPEGLQFTLNTDPKGTGATGENKRTARFTILAFDFPSYAVIDDEVVDDADNNGVDDYFVCPTGLKCPSGGWTEAVIPGPGDDPFSPPFIGHFTGSSSINLVLTYDVSTIPSGLTPKNYVLLHDLDYDPTTILYEPISESCRSHDPPCLNSVQKQRNGDFVVNAEVTGNWRYR